MSNTALQIPVVGTIQEDAVPDALANCRVEFSVAGETALALVNLRKSLAACNGGQLGTRDRNRLIRRCRRLGFNAVWTRFVLGRQ